MEFAADYLKSYLRLENLPTGAVIYIAVLVALFGLVMGSALNCRAYRMANKKSWTKGHSICPKCSHELKAKDLVPLFSYVFLGGKCRYCRSPIPVRYPLTELILAACYTALLFRFDLTIQLIVCMILVSCLFTLSLIDLDIQIIPDRFLLIPALFRIAQLLYEGGFAALWHALIPALIFGGGLLVISLVMDKVLGKESMGGGDIKLMALLGLFFTIPECLLLLVLACVIGLVMAAVLVKLKSGKPFPFGPALSIAAFITLLVGQAVTGWYLGLF